MTLPSLLRALLIACCFLALLQDGFAQDDLKSRADVRKALDFIEANHDAQIAKQIEIAQIPAPGFEEAKRAAFIEGEFRRLGLQNVTIDGIGNVLGLLPGRSERMLAIAAHLDTVFPAGTDVTVKKQGARLVGPGLVDDCRGLTAMLALVAALRHAGIQTNQTLLFVADVGEEGLGNLRGIRYLFEQGQYRERIDSFISIDGADTAVITSREIGSRRYRLAVKGPGGHSYIDFGRVNPAHALSRIIARFAEIEAPKRPKTTYNVGRIGGGTSVNSIPFEAWAEIDMRSEEEGALDKVEAQMLEFARAGVEEENRLRGASGTKLEIDAKLLAVRRATRTPDDAALVRAALWAARAMGLTPELKAGSTDSNVPENRGVQALTIGGGGKGGSYHSLEEWFEPEGAYKGIQQILLMTLAFDQMKG